MHGESGHLGGDRARDLRLTAGRVTAIVTLVGGVLAFVAAQWWVDTTVSLTPGYQFATMVIAGIPSILVMRLRPDDSRRRIELLLLLQSVTLVGMMSVTAVRYPGDQPPLAFLAVGLVASAHLLRARTAAIVLGVSLTVVGVGQVASGNAVGPVAWTMTAVATIGALTIAAVVSQRRALERETLARSAALDANDALHAVLEAARAAASADHAAVIEAVVHATRTLGADSAALRLFDDDGRLCYAATMAMPLSMAGKPRPPGEGLAGEVLRQGRTVVLDDYAAFSGALPTHVDHGLRTGVGVPLALPDGTVLGVLTVGRLRDESWSTAAVGAIELLAQHAARALQLSRDVVADRELLAALKALQARQADFVATVSHELRTPLTVIKGMTSTLLGHNEEMPVPARRQLLERVAANTTVLESIIEALLDTARLDGGLTAAATELSLSDLAADAVGRLEALSPHHELILDAHPTEPVLADRQLLERVFENLVSNAMRHTPPGTTVTVRVRQQGGRVQVEIADDGPGITPELLPRITQRFVRGGDVDTRSTRGLGIGLALVEEVLQLHGSRLGVVSRAGQGATFSFSLPLAAHPDSDVLTATRDQTDGIAGGDPVVTIDLDLPSSATH